MAGSIKVKGYTRRDGVKVKGFTRKLRGKSSHKTSSRKTKRRRSPEKHIHRIMRTPEYRRAAATLMKKAHSKARKRRRA